MERYLWFQTISKSYCPQWPCPNCGRGTLTLIPDSFVCEETAASIRLHNDDNFDFDMVEYLFTAWAHCSNARCRQKFSITGRGGVGPESVDEDDGNVKFVDIFTPLFVHPMPDIIAIPPQCPKEIATELRAAFSLFWASPKSCAGRIRVGLELIMNHLGAPKRKKTTNNRLIDLTLHARIDAFAAKNNAVGSQLMALKWLGNAGSHDGEVGQPDLLDAFEILEHALGEIVEGRSARVAALAKKLAKKHGARKK